MEASSIISINIETLTINEDIGTAVIPISRTGDLNLESLVDYSINDGSAQSGQDFRGTSGTLNFASGVTVQEIRVPIIEDNLFETDETFSVAIGNPTGALLGGIRTANIVIQDNDTNTDDTVAFSDSEYIIREDRNKAIITVSRTGDINKTATVDYATENYYAKADLDYIPASGTLTFAPGEISQTFDISIINDSLPEINEPLNINLSNPVGVGLGLQDSARLTIRTDDPVRNIFPLDREILANLPKDPEARLNPGPTAFDCIQDGTMFIGTLDGKVQVFDGNSLLERPFIDLSDQVNTGGQRGLLGLGIHPNFPETPYVYLAFSYDPPNVIPDQSGEGRVTRLVRYTANPGTNYRTALPNSEVILLETPPVQNFHAAGAIRFGKNGELFFSHGDGTEVSNTPTLAATETLQSIDNPFGKLFRIDPITGNGYSDNPFYNGDSTSIESKIYNYGLRNPWRFAIHPETGEPFIGDVGWANWEELNTGRGENFGWPIYEGGNGNSLRNTAIANDPSFQDLYDSAQVTAPIYGISHENDGGRSITLGDFYSGDRYTEIYQDALFLADFQGDNRVDAITFDEQGNIESVLNFAGDNNITYIATGPDDYLYYANLVTGQIGRWINSSLAAPTSPTEEDDSIVGGNSNDLIFGLEGDDQLIGNGGNDSLRGDQGNDSLYGGLGQDWLFGSDGSDQLFGQEKNDTLIGGNNIDSLMGGSGNDKLFGGQGDDWLHGGGNNDLLNGGTGNDKLYGTKGNDTLIGGNNRDSLWGGSNNDQLFGGTGSDLLEGGKGNDYLNGGIGNDTLIGDQGNDILIGSDGADLFTIKSIEGRNLISDFEPGTDLLEIPENISLGNLNITSNGDNTGTLILDNMGREIVVLQDINPNSLDLSRDFS